MKNEVKIIDDVEEIGYFASIGGTITDLTNIDFSPWGIKCFQINSPNLKLYIDSISIDQLKVLNYERIIKNSKCTFYDESHEHFDADNMCILTPISLDNLPAEYNYFEAINALLLIFPSELYIRNIYHAQIFNKKSIHINGWSNFEKNYILRKPGNKTFDNHLDYPEKKLDEANQFLKIFKERIDKLGYVKNALKYYSNSFRVNDPELAFVSLCICMETIVPTGEQLTYRFRRNLAVLCGEDLASGKVIYENAKKLYDFRSKVVHSAMDHKNYKKFYEYYEYAMILASRMIIEFVNNNMLTINELDSRINEIGIGDRNKISKDYKPFKGNLFTAIDVFLKKLK